METRFKKRIWIIPLIMAALVAVFGWWADNRLRQIIEDQLETELKTTLNANVTALEIWMTNQTKLATTLAEEPTISRLASGILDQLDKMSTNASGTPNLRNLNSLLEVRQFVEYVPTRVGKLGYDIVHLVSTNLLVVANSRNGRLGPGFQVHEDHKAKFMELFANGEPIIITPFKPAPPPPPPGGRGRGGRRGGPGGFPFMFGNPGTNSNREFGRGGFPGADGPPQRGFGPPPGELSRNREAIMQVAAPVRDALNTVRGALALGINPDTEYTRILSVARSGNSGETYAFDQRGVMISRSRFDRELKELGLIEDRTNVSSAVTLRLGDPGGDVTKGFKPTGDPTNRPLTRLVLSAFSTSSGVDLEPSRDYRGVPVVGAWRWLPDHGFGVVTQRDADEAFQPLRVLKTLFVILFLLLVLCSTGMFVFSYSSFVSRRKLGEAELRLKQLGQYTLEEKIGEGGMGVVYRARHALLRRETAVKLLLPDRADEGSVARFEREVCLTCQLTHPNTIQVYDYGHTPEGIFYYAMEYLRGLNLQELISQFGPQSEGRVIHILVQICDALAEAHSVGLVHRDIKPANVFLCERGGVPDCVKVLDFGLVRQYLISNGGSLNQTDEKRVLGTPLFMPPEGIKNTGPSNPRSDIYSVGALGYYLLTGHYVFTAESIIELYEKHLTEKLLAPSSRTTNPISSELEKAILKCLNRDPEKRPQSVTELRELLLASPRATDWTREARAEWWKKNPVKSFVPSDGKGHHSSDPIGATVKIDFATRIE